MKIQKLELLKFRLPLIRPFRTSFGTQTEKEAIIVRVKGKDTAGYGECVAGSDPSYSPETTVTAWHIIRDYLAPLLIESEPAHPSGVSELFSDVRGNPMAKAALEMACWDLYSRQEGLSLSTALGGERKAVNSGISIGIQEDLSSLLDIISRSLEIGYPRIKIKIEPGWDIGVVEEVRKEFPRITLMVDANAAYGMKQLDRLTQLDQYNLLMIEQPFGYDDFVNHATLQKQIETPLCLDESVHSYHDAEQAIELNSCRVINIKPGRVGGFSESKRIAELAERHEVRVWCGGMLETGIGRAHNVALASLPNFQLPNDISENRRFFTEDITEPTFRLNEQFQITVPSGTGMGVEVREDFLAERTMERLTI